jgi:hypothetical protein
MECNGLHSNKFVRIEYARALDQLFRSLNLCSCKGRSGQASAVSQDVMRSLAQNKETFH